MVTKKSTNFAIFIDFFSIFLYHYNREQQEHINKY